MSTMPRAARAKIAPRLSPMTVYAANSDTTTYLCADPAARGSPRAIGSGVHRVSETVVGVMGAGAVAERHRPSGIEVLDSVQGVDQRRPAEIGAGFSRRRDE